MRNDQIVVADRFRGPPTSANGGYFAGLLAGHVGGTARVRLSAPPPLDTPLRLVREAESVRALAGEELIAQAWPAELDVDVPTPPDAEAAAEASTRFPGFERHPFPGCFVCGTEREAGDGLHVYAGSLSGTPGHAAAPWVPDASLGGSDGRVRPEYLWAALDCPGAFTFPHPPDTLTLLGEMTARTDGGLKPGQPATVLAWLIAGEGRKRMVGTAVFDGSGACVAQARSTWILVPA